MQIDGNEPVMKGKKGSSAMLIVLTCILFFSTVYLYLQNAAYRKINRQLILQNDSIISVNIHLADTLKKESGVSLSITNTETN